MKKYLVTALCFPILLLYGAKYHPGVAGQAFEGRVRLNFDQEKLTPRSGSVVFWFKTSCNTETVKNAMFLCLGINKPGWFYIRLNRGEFGIHFRNAKGGTTANCSARELGSGKWHHAAVVWGKRKNGFVRIYLNGKLSLYQRLPVPERFSSNVMAIGYNSSNWKAPGFPGMIDELAVFDVPLSEDMIKNIYDSGKNGKVYPECPGRLLYFSFDGNTSAAAGKSSSPDAAQKLLRMAYRKAKIKKYVDEIDFNYSFNVPSQEKTPYSLTDGNDGTGVVWRQIKPVITGEFDRTQDVTEIEITTRKYTKWYLLKQLQISWDDGSGIFSDPVLLNTYAFGKKAGKKLIDESCRKYVYSLKNPGKMCRFRITLIGDAYFGINEIRVRVKK